MGKVESVTLQPMNKGRLPPFRLRRVFTFINETRWIGWGLPLIGILVAIANYRIVSPGDRPEVHITEAYAGRTSAASSDTTWVAKYKNDGTKAAAHITVKLGTVDLATKKSKILAPPDKLERLAVGPPFETAVAEFKFKQEDVYELFVICLYYSDDNGKTYRPVANFYKVSAILISSSDGRCCELADATTVEQEALSDWFTCAKL
jgi:hypothetical protein